MPHLGFNHKSSFEVRSPPAPGSTIFYPGSPVPPPPIKLTPALATDPHTSNEVLWYIARKAPHLRKWLIANESSTPELLEFVAQIGGPGVKEGFQVLFDEQ